jgi:hypothetical protein
MPRGLLAKAQAFTGPREKPGLLHAALKASIDGESARPLARLVGIARLARRCQLGGGRRHAAARRKWPGFRKGVDAAAGGEDFAGFANGGSGGINAV